MKLADIAEWFFANGFRRSSSPNGQALSLESEHGACTVSLVLTQRKVVSHICRGGVWQPLMKTKPQSLEKDRYGMIRGAGLFTEFVDRMHRGEQPPRWFPVALRNVLVEEVAEWRRATALREDPRAREIAEGRTCGLGWYDVEDWLEENGFEQIDTGYHEAEYGAGSIGVLVDAMGVTTLWLMPDDERVLKTAPLSALSIDEFGMLQDAGLDREFRELAETPEQLPYWFPVDYADAVSDVISPDTEFAAA